MIHRRSDACAAVVHDKVYVIGGYTGETVLQTIEVYSPELDNWTEIAHMFSPRSGLKNTFFWFAIIRNKNIFIFAM